MTEPLATLRFAVREPVGKNATLARGRGRRLYKTAEAVAFQERIAYAATIAFATSRIWPRDLAVVHRVRVTTQLYNTRHDCLAVRGVVKDALQGILYRNDRTVSDGPEDLPLKDGGERRVEVTVELLALCTPVASRPKRVRKPAC